MDNTVNVNAANLAAIKDNNLDDIKFATVLRGYRQDQVDVVIDALLTEIAQLRKQVAEINSTPQ
jgi:divIVA domain protein